MLRVLALSCFTGLTSAATRPLHPKNVTMYHVGLSNTTGLADQNSGDSWGDAEFMVRAAGLGYLCSNASGEKDYTYDCDDAEQAGTGLVVSQFLVEVAGNDWSEYAECNIFNGSYSCECRNNSDHSHHHHHHTDVPCQNPVGRINVTDESGFARDLPDTSNPYENTSYRFYFYNAAQKLGGIWYSTLSTGNCDAGGAAGVPQKNCTWRVVEQVKRVDKVCQESKVFDVVEQQGAACFKRCSADGSVHRNLTDGCWTKCFYDTALGPNANSTAYPANATVQHGMPAQVLRDAWVAGMDECPQV